MNQINHWEGKTALITGASSGIGEATARRLAGNGLTVLLAARRVERLEIIAKDIRAAGGKAFVLQVDLSRADERAALPAKAQELAGGVDVLVNNAGLGWYGYLAEMPLDLMDEILEINIQALVDLTRRFLPGMIAKKSGTIINISSVSAGIPSQGIAIYGSTKAFVDSFSTALYRELKGSGVNVCSVRPGAVVTEFYPKAAEQLNGFPVPAEGTAISADKAAKTVWSVLQRPRRFAYVPGVLAITPWVEMLFGWAIDQLGPLLLRQAKRKAALKFEHESRV
jgi:uncharacterized protein